MVNLDYDVKAAFEAIEHELMMSMIRNMKRHRVEEIDEDKQWAMWQTLQLQSLEKYRRQNASRFGRDFRRINSELEALIRIANDRGMMEQETAILKAIKKGFFAIKRGKGATAEFFRLNERKLEALVKATTHDMERAEVAVLRMANDRYRKVIFNAQMYVGTGAATYEKAVDMATRDFASAGMNCVEYSNGARHTVADYADMALRTATKRAYLQGEGTKRQEWGIHTVIVNKRSDRGPGGVCPKCLPFVGKVFIDDVWSGGRASDGPYPLISTAIDAGLYHPRCKDSHTTYFPGVSTPPDDTFTREEVEEVAAAAREVANAQYGQREAERHQRIAETRLDPENREIEEARAREAARVAEERQRALEQAERRSKIEDAFKQYVSGDGTFVNNYLAGRYEELGATWTESDQQYLELLDEGTKGLVKQKKLWRSVDASAVFGDMSTAEYEDFYDYLTYGESAVPREKAEKFRRKLEEATGKTISEPRFMSTSSDKEVAMGWGDFSGSSKPVVIEFDVPEDIRGADLKHLDIEGDEQSEVLLARGQKYRVKSVGVEDGQIVVKAELISEDDVGQAAEGASQINTGPDIITPNGPLVDATEADHMADGDLKMRTDLLSGDVQKISTAVNKFLERVEPDLPKPAWTGKTIIVPDSYFDRRGGKKAVARACWDGIIRFRESHVQSIQTHIHELLHARSVIAYGLTKGPEMLIKHKPVEEGCVEFLTQEICKRSRIEYSASYDNYVKPLRDIRRITLPMETDYDFARALFDIPLEKRYAYIESIVSAFKESHHDIRQGVASRLEEACAILSGKKVIT